VNSIMVHDRNNNENDNHGRRILVVDDEPDPCLTFQKVIEDYDGYKVDIHDKPRLTLQDFKEVL
jgi:hypothetical protein